MQGGNQYTYFGRLLFSEECKSCWALVYMENKDELMSGLLWPGPSQNICNTCTIYHSCWKHLQNMCLLIKHRSVSSCITVLFMKWYFGVECRMNECSSELLWMNESIVTILILCMLEWIKHLLFNLLWILYSSDNKLQDVFKNLLEME